MAEVGLLPFARIALQVAKAVLPRYRSRFSKHQFTQPQLLAILCLMRYEDWTFREAEVRLGEHGELRQALGLTSCARFHDRVSVLAAAGRTKPSTKPSVIRCAGCAALVEKADDEPVSAWTPRVGSRSGQHVLCASTWSLERLREFAHSVQTASQQTRIGLALADAEFDSERITPTFGRNSEPRL